MISYQTLQRLLEFMNGGWLICCTALVVVSAAYLVTSWRELDLWPRSVMRLPTGMRVGVAVCGIGLAVAITRGTIWYWRVTGAGDFSGWMLAALLGGAALGCASFLLGIKEFGAPLFGEAPWILTVTAMIVFIAVGLAAGR